MGMSGTFSRIMDKLGKLNIDIFYQNVRGLRTRLLDLYTSVSSSSYDIIILTETWLNSNINNGEILDDRYVV